MELPLLGLVLLIVGCASPAPPASFPPAPLPASSAAAPAPAPTTTTTAATTIAPPGRLGHYSSGDGSVGFVLDRLGPTPKILLDGTSAVIDFEPDGKTAGHTDFVNKKAHVFMRFEANGRVNFSHGSFDGVVARDAGAASLRGGAGNVTEPPASNAPKLRLGHYSSGDGMTGFVLDRTGPRVRMQMDGASDVLELDSELKLRGRGVVVRFGDSGEVTYFTGIESIAMRRDADADPLSH